MNRLLCLTLCVLTAISYTSCSEDDDPIEAIIPEYEITYIPLIDGMGDCSYTDSCYAAIYRSALQIGARLNVVVPDTTGNAVSPQEAIDEWYAQRASDDRHRLLILGDCYYADYLKEKDYRMGESGQVLIIDCMDREVDAYTFSFPLYGVCYLCGLIASQKDYFDDPSLPEGFADLPCAVYAANDKDLQLTDGIAGFIDGMRHLEGEMPDSGFIAREPNQGFLDMLDVIKAAMTYNGDYRFVLPLAGGNCRALTLINNQGLHAPIVHAGVDISLTLQDPYQICAFAKNFRYWMNRFIVGWRQGESPAQHQVMMLKDEGTMFFEGDLILKKEPIGLGHNHIEQLRQIAIAKEEEYYDGRL